MIKQALFIIVLSCLFINPIKADIISTYSINSSTIDNLIEIIDPSSLVIINLDETIVTPKAKMFSYQGSPYRTFIISLIASSENKSFVDQSLKTWFENRKVQLVEPEWPSIIDRIKNIGATIIGIVELDTRIYGLVKDITERRYKEIIDLEINFISQINNKPIININSSLEVGSLFYKGILFTGSFSEGKTLIDFIKVTNISPKKIFVFSYRDDELKQVGYHLRKFDIEYYGVHYLAITNRTEVPDSKIIKLQQDSLLLENKWLEDEEAENLLTLKAKNSSSNGK